MAKEFDIKAEGMVDLALLLQQINDVALPFAMQNTLNDIARDVKTKALTKSANAHFSVRRPTFFRANSGYKSYKAKDFGYNINRLRAEVGMTEAKKAYDKATEQIGSQETASPIKRSINPLGEKPLTSVDIDILSKKPEIYDSSINTGEHAYFRAVQRAQSRGSGVIFARGGRGTLRKVNSIKKRKPTKADPRKYIIKTTPIASYLKGGFVKLSTRRPFLTGAVAMSMGNVQSIFEKNARKQFERLRS